MKNQSTTFLRAGHVANRRGARAMFPGRGCFGGLAYRRGDTECSLRFEDLKERLTAQLLREFNGTVSTSLLQRAIKEAEALAAATPVPALVFPELAREKTQEAHAWQTRQRLVYQRTLSFAE
jgi:hypothetical protein